MSVRASTLTLCYPFVLWCLHPFTGFTLDLCFSIYSRFGGFFVYSISRVRLGYNALCSTSSVRIHIQISFCFHSGVFRVFWLWWYVRFPVTRHLHQLKLLITQRRPEGQFFARGLLCIQRLVWNLISGISVQLFFSFWGY
jgi:hypothetical protein